MSMYEVFNPVTGYTMRIVRWEWLARWMTWHTSLDYDNV